MKLRQHRVRFPGPLRSDAALLLLREARAFGLRNGATRDGAVSEAVADLVEGAVQIRAPLEMTDRIEETDLPDTYVVYGRGELMLSVLAETMRREGYEFALGMPEVVTKEVDGVVMEPLERVVLDIPEEYVGAIQDRQLCIKMIHGCWIPYTWYAGGLSRPRSSG